MPLAAGAAEVAEGKSSRYLQLGKSLIIGGIESSPSSYTPLKAFAVGHKFMEEMDLRSHPVSPFSHVCH